MIRLIGVCLIVSAVIDFFFSKSRTLAVESKQMNEFYLYLKQLDINLMTYNFDTVKLIQITSNASLFADNDFICELSKRISIDGDFNLAFRNTVDKNKILEELGIIESYEKVAEVIGKKDVDYQHKMLNLCIQEVNDKKVLQNLNLDEKKAFYRKLGFLSGIFVIIILM